MGHWTVHYISKDNVIYEVSVLCRMPFLTVQDEAKILSPPSSKAPSRPKLFLSFETRTKLYGLTKPILKTAQKSTGFPFKTE